VILNSLAVSSLGVKCNVNLSRLNKKPNLASGLPWIQVDIGDRKDQSRYYGSALHHRYFSSFAISEGEISNLNPWFITGFADAEGCFTVSV
jgi:hypothetical protein